MWHIDIEQMVLEIYPQLMENYRKATPTLSAQDLVEVRFEDLEANLCWKFEESTND